MTIDIPAGQYVAVSNSGTVNWTLQYSGTDYHYPAGEVVIVPFAVAHKHFGFEFDEAGKLYRTADEDYEDGDETAAHYALASTLPHSWNSNALRNQVIPADDEGGAAQYAGKKYSEAYQLLRKSFLGDINAKAVPSPRRITPAQFASLS
jgi:hypothetical protein